MRSRPPNILATPNYFLIVSEGSKLHIERTGKTWYRVRNAILDTNLDVTRPSGRTVTTEVVKGKEWVPDLKNPELDQITFLLYPNEVNCTLKGLERPGIESETSNLVSHVRLEGLS
jgi:hypothetical protein